MFVETLCTMLCSNNVEDEISNVMFDRVLISLLVDVCYTGESNVEETQPQNTNKN